VAAMTRLMTDTKELRQMQQASRAIAAGHSVACAASRIEDVLYSATRS
jgi:hypothetical protein